MIIGHFGDEKEDEARINAILTKAERAYETAVKLEADARFAADNEWIAARIAAHRAKAA